MGESILALKASQAILIYFK